MANVERKGVGMTKTTMQKYLNYKKAVALGLSTSLIGHFKPSKLETFLFNEGAKRYFHATMKPTKEQILLEREIIIDILALATMGLSPEKLLSLVKKNKYLVKEIFDRLTDNGGKFGCLRIIDLWHAEGSARKTGEQKVIPCANGNVEFMFFVCRQALEKRTDLIIKSFL